MTDRIDTAQEREWLDKLPRNNGTFLDLMRFAHEYLDALDAERVEVDRLRGRLRSEFELGLSTLERAEKAEAERDQALARLAVAQAEMREKCVRVVDNYTGTGFLADQIRARPLDSDAEAALQRVVDSRMGLALEACQIIDDAVREGHDNTSDLILHLLTAVEPARATLKRPEASHE